MWGTTSSQGTILGESSAQLCASLSLHNNVEKGTSEGDSFFQRGRSLFFFSLFLTFASLKPLDIFKPESEHDYELSTAAKCSLAETRPYRNQSKIFIQSRVNSLVTSAV